MRVSHLVAAAIAVVVLLTAPLALAQQIQQVPQAAAPRPAGPAMPSMAAPTIPPINMVPSFIQKGKVYTFVIVRKELKGEVMEVDRTGWIRVNFLEDDEEYDGIPWVNLNHITLILPDKPTVKPAKD